MFVRLVAQGAAPGGRESFPVCAVDLFLVVARKRLPSPSSLRRHHVPQHRLAHQGGLLSPRLGLFARLRNETRGCATWLLTVTALPLGNSERSSLRGWRANRRGIVNRPSLRFGLVLLRRVAQGTHCWASQQWHPTPCVGIFVVSWCRCGESLAARAQEIEVAPVDACTEKVSGTFFTSSARISIRAVEKVPDNLFSGRMAGQTGSGTRRFVFRTTTCH